MDQYIPRTLKHNKHLSSTCEGGTHWTVQENEKIFKDWIGEGNVEVFLEAEIKAIGHYLPHRPMVKPSSTTTPSRHL